MAIKVPKGAGSKLGRTETVSIRLDPRLNYLCELAARSQRRTKSSFIEATLAEHIQRQVINKWRNSDFDEPDTFGERADVLWHVRESQRLVSLGIIAPELLTFEEQHIWALIEENGHFGAVVGGETIGISASVWTPSSGSGLTNIGRTWLRSRWARRSQTSFPVLVRRHLVETATTKFLSRGSLKWLFASQRSHVLPSVL